MNRATLPAEGPCVRSIAPEAAAGGTVTYTWSALTPGTYLIRTTYQSIQGPMGLYGVLVITTAPVVTGGAITTPGTADPGISYDADVALLLSEIDPAQNSSVDANFQGLLNTPVADFSETTPWTPACGQAHTCYPPAVDSSAVPVPATYSNGNVLPRFEGIEIRHGVALVCQVGPYQVARTVYLHKNLPSGVPPTVVAENSLNFSKGF